MKKIFTLIAALVLSLNLFAVKYSVGAPTNNATDWYDAATKTITFLEAGSYKPGWWLAWNNAAGANSGQDMSAYDEFVVELGEADYDITVYFEYVDETITPEAVSGKGGKIVVPLNATGKSAVKQAYLQVQEDGVGKTVEFKDAYFQNNEEAPTSYVIYEDPASTTAIDWSGTLKYDLDNTAKSLLVAGNKIRIEFSYVNYENEDDQYYQAQVMGSWWTILPSTSTMPNATVTAGNTILDLKDCNGVLDITLTDGDISILNQQGSLLLCGHGIYVNKVTIGQLGDADGISNATIAPVQNENAPLYNLAGQQVSKAYKGVVIQNGKKFFQK